MCRSPDGTRLASGSWDGAVRVWDAVSGACMHVLEGHTGRVESVCWSPDGSRLVSGSWDKTVRVWDAVSGACVHAPDGHAGQKWNALPPKRLRKSWGQSPWPRVNKDKMAEVTSLSKRKSP